MTTEIFEHNGKKYRLADERDIGKRVWRSDEGLKNALSFGTTYTLKQINSTAEYKFITTSHYPWKYAYVELEAEVESATTEPPRPDWLPEGARILGDDEVIEKGDKYHIPGDCSGPYTVLFSVGVSHREARDTHEKDWIWFRPAPPEPTTTEPEQPATTDLDNRIARRLAASRYMAACHDYDLASERLEAAGQEMRELAKQGPSKFVIKSDYDFKHYLFEVDSDGSFTKQEIELL